MKVHRRVLLWVLFVLICMGLGYPALSRYDPTKLAGTSDAAVYRNMVVGRAPQPVSGTSGADARLAQWENYSRVLVPYLARPFYWIAKGRVGTWDPALLGLLVANAIFTATTTGILVAIGYRLTRDGSTALLGATLYLLNFAVVNLSLAGLVDAGEGCFVMAVVWSLLMGRWFLLPLWGVAGALAKETFVPLGVMFAAGWWLSEVRRGRWQVSRLAWIGAAGVAGLITVTLVVSAVTGGWIWPWQFAGYMSSGAGFFAALRACLLNRTFAYVFIWLLPLGCWRLNRLPQSWVLGSAVAVCGAFALGAYHDAGDNAARPLFSIAGPLLSLSAAIFLSGSSGAGSAVPKVIEDGTEGLTS